MDKNDAAREKNTKLWNYFTVIACILGVLNAVALCVLIVIGISYVRDQLPAIVDERLDTMMINSKADRQKRAASDPSSHCTQGPPGRDGRDGRDGLRGDSGLPGITGPRGPPGPVNPDIFATVQINEVLRRIDDIVNTSRHCEAGTGTGGSAPGSGGSVYVRWGRTTCPGHTTLLYDGATGGSSHLHKGGGANYICLPQEPDWANTTDGHQIASAIFGAEYETSSYTKGDMFSRVNAFGKSLHDHDVPCAVCHAESRNSQVMIPAKLNCPSGWDKEYSGYLMSEYRLHSRAEFVCVDGSPEADPSGLKNENGALLYFVEAYCGSLPCPKYQEGLELTCVVCTK